MVFRGQMDVRNVGLPTGDIQKPTCSLGTDRGFISI